MLESAIFIGDLDLVKLVVTHPRFKPDVTQRLLLSICETLEFEHAADMRK